MNLRLSIRSVGPIALSVATLAILVIVNSIFQPNFFSFFNISSSLRAFLPLVIISIGQTLVIQGGAIDLSVGNQVSLLNVLLVSLLEPAQGDPLRTIVAIAIALVAAVLCGLFNGLLVTRGGLQPILTTFATGTMFGGVALWIMPTPGGTVSALFYQFYAGTFLGLPSAAWLLGIAVVFVMWFQKTRLFKHIIATGGNRIGAFQSGLPVLAISTGTYLIVSICTFLATLLIIADTTSGNPLLGPSYSLDSITAVIIGGVPIIGGRGSLFGGIVGALILNYINNVVFFARISVTYQRLLQAVIVVIALGAGGVITQRRSK